MDVNATLAEIRSLAALVSDVSQPPALTAARATDLAERVIALDEWIGNGGFLPTDWRTSANNGW